MLHWQSGRLNGPSLRGVFDSSRMNTVMKRRAQPSRLTSLSERAILHIEGVALLPTCLLQRW